MRKILLLSLAVLGLVTACDDTTDTLGSSLTNREDLITVSDGVFKIVSRSITVDSVLAKNTKGYLGNVKDPETGVYIKSDFITQFHVPETFAFPNDTSFADGVKADSCDLRLFFDSFYGDSLTTLKATVYELSKPVEENVDYYSTFDPEKYGMIRVGEGRLQSTKVFSLTDKNYSDSLRNTDSYTNHVLFRFEQEYTDRNGEKYNNYGTYLLKRYYANKEDFRNSYTFSHNVCPGFYVKFENGLGAMARISTSQICTYYTVHDTIDHKSYSIFAGTEEVRQITRMTTDSGRLKELAEDKTCTYIKSPAGIFTELTLPIEDIMNGHENDSVNAAKVELRALVNTVDSKYSFAPPSTILMVEKSKMEEFFKEEKMPDYRTSYISSYSSTTGTFTFSNIGHLLKDIYKHMPTDVLEREEWKRKNPDWNKVVLIPINAQYTTYGSSSILTGVSHDMSLSSVRLIGGEENPNGDIEITVIYSKFNN